MPRGPCAGPRGLFLLLPPSCMFTKECGLEVDCNRVQERACAKAGSTLCRSTCVVLYSKTCTWVVITCCESWLRVKSNAGGHQMGRDVNMLRAELLLCISVYRQARASIYICTTSVRYNRSRDGRGGNIVGTDGTPPQFLFL